MISDTLYIELATLQLAVTELKWRRRIWHLIDTRMWLVLISKLSTQPVSFRSTSDRIFYMLQNVLLN